MRRLLLAAYMTLLSPAYADPCPAEARIGQRYKAAVTGYVGTKYGWPKSEYCIERRRDDNQYAVFTIVHNDDTKALMVGGGKSFELYLDPKTLRVFKEMYFQ